MGNGMSGDWVKALTMAGEMGAARSYLTPWPEALRALGGLQSKRIGARVTWLFANEGAREPLQKAGAIDEEGRLTTLGAMLALDEAERIFRDAFEL